MKDTHNHKQDTKRERVERKIQALLVESEYTMTKSTECGALHSSTTLIKYLPVFSKLKEASQILLGAVITGGRQSKQLDSASSGLQRCM